MTQENKRWHTDKIVFRFGPEILKGPRKDALNMIAKEVVKLWKEAKMERKKMIPHQDHRRLVKSFVYTSTYQHIYYVGNATTIPTTIS